LRFSLSTKLIKFGCNLKEIALTELIQASTKEEIEIIRKLFLEYADWLGFELCFQGFDEELASLPGKYAPPKGRLYLLKENENYAGCIALREIDEGISEMKRLYVKPEYRGRGYGNLMCKKLIEDAKAIGYKKMRLDTIGERMKSAYALYKSFGFYEIEPYNYNPQPGVVYMELELK
jgi:ribosomal protein S18 acetylase RimI-like enzyme